MLYSRSLYTFFKSKILTETFFFIFSGTVEKRVKDIASGLISYTGVRPLSGDESSFVAIYASKNSLGNTYKSKRLGPTCIIIISGLFIDSVAVELGNVHPSTQLR